MVTEAKEIMRSIQAVDETIAQQTLVQKKQAKEQARVRSHVRAVAQGKDVVVPASPDKASPTLTKKSGLKLPVPKQSGSSRDPFGGRGLSIQAIIGEVLILQAKDQSQFWSTTWKQASEAQKAFVSFAPIIASNTKANWDAQAAATDNEAAMAKADGWTDLVTAGVAITVGALADGVGGACAADDGATSFTDTVNAPGDTEMSTLDSAGNKIEDEGSAAEEGGSKVSKTTEKEADTLVKKSNWYGKLKRVGSAVKRSVTKKGIANAMQKAMQNAFTADIASRAIKGLTVDSKYKSMIAENQRAAGRADSIAKESEQYAQYWTQLFSRQEDLRGAAQQNLDYGMNVFKSISDTTTQTITSMFRG